MRWNWILSLLHHCSHGTRAHSEEHSLCHHTGDLPKGQPLGTSGFHAFPVCCLSKTSRAPHSPIHLLCSPSPTAKGISRGLLSWEVTQCTARSGSWGADPSEGRDRPSAPALTQPVVRVQRPFRWLKCVIIALIPSHTSIRAAKIHAHPGSALSVPFCCVTMANRGDVQLPALSHCRLPKNKRVLDCSFTGTDKHTA